MTTLAYPSSTAFPSSTLYPASVSPPPDTARVVLAPLTVVIAEATTRGELVVIERVVGDVGTPLLCTVLQGNGTALDLTQLTSATWKWATGAQDDTRDAAIAATPVGLRAAGKLSMSWTNALPLTEAGVYTGRLHLDFAGDLELAPSHGRAVRLVVDPAD